MHLFTLTVSVIPLNLWMSVNDLICMTYVHAAGLMYTDCLKRYSEDFNTCAANNCKNNGIHLSNSDFCFMLVLLHTFRVFSQCGQSFVYINLACSVSKWKVI